MTVVDYQPNRATDSSVVSQRPDLDITVAIPTYNGAERIPQVLDRLRQQEGIDNLRWEVIVCDNNSYDHTLDVVVEYQKNWPKEYPLRYCFVPEQGAAFARQRAVTEAHGQIVAFLDDDNIPAYDWLFNVNCFAQAYPQAGAFGSQIHGDFQGSLPDGFEQIACFLAIVERGNKPHLYTPKSKILPPAAGLAVRKKAWLNAVPERLFLNHKGKKAGLASEDLEAMLYIQKAGWEIWYNSDMVVTHQIPSKRLQQEYLVALFRCVGLSRFYIRWLGTKDWQRLFKAPAYIANDLRKLALHYLKNGFYQTDLTTVTACERALLKSTVVSPAFLLRKASQEIWQTRLDNTQLPERQKWLQRLADAFESRHLELYRQEIVHVNSSSIPDNQTHFAQFEVLIRLPQTAVGEPPASPALFFPTAERYGLMKTLDRRVIQQVFEALNSRSAQEVNCLNLSSGSVCDPGFSSFLEENLKRYQVKPESLCFEIQACTLLTFFDAAQALVECLKTLGFLVAIDEITDIESYQGGITQLSVNYFKLSQTLWNSSEFTGEAVQSWVDCTQRRGIELVAKGVETQSMMERLQKLGISHMQGYYLSKPTPFTQITTA
ncbi:MAG: hormogonium polysaccharide biosynthesis glycosyltransferase HpsE [Cyanobacteria bacterium P01_H01_bin.21]